MSRRSKPSWSWTLRISRASEPQWLERMEARGESNWMIVERPGRISLSLQAYFSTRSQAQQCLAQWGGSVRRVSAMKAQPEGGPPIVISKDLEIVRAKPGRALRPDQLCIPYGVAFGSGEHATTLMLLRALSRRRDWTDTNVLDLGTGSGVLALAARKLGARKVAGVDFDPDSIRTARQNEAMNFPARQVVWEQADVKKLPAKPAYALIVANLFSGILCEAAPRIARAIEPSGELWLSGVLRSQQEEVAAAYRAAGLKQLKTTTRGKWVMQQWRALRDPGD